MRGKLFQALKLVFSKSSAASTAAEHGRERYRKAGRTTLTAMAANAVNIVTGLIIVPITLSYLGKERYGLWVALTSFVAFLTFTDMGLGIGLQNALSECNGRDDRKNPVFYVSSAFFLMVLMFVILAAAAIFVLPQIPFDRLIKVESEIARKELLPTAQVMLIVFGFGLPAGLFQRIYNAYQQGYWANLWLTSGRVAGLLAVLIGIWLKLGLPALVGWLVGVPAFFMALGSFFLYCRMPGLRPSIRAATWPTTKRIFNTGSKALVVQFSAVLISSGPAFIIANQLGTSSVTPFAVAQKLLATSGIILSTVLVSLWPAYGEAAARGDWAWVKKTFRHSVKLGFAIQIPVFILISFLGTSIINFWAGENAVPSWSILMAVNVWYLIAVWNNCAAVTLNGLDHMIGQAIYSPIAVLLGLSVAFFIVPSYGVSGVVWSVTLITILAAGIGVAVELWWVLRNKR